MNGCVSCAKILYFIWCDLRELIVLRLKMYGSCLKKIELFV